MSVLISTGAITVVKALGNDHNRGMQVTVHADEVSAAMDMINSGTFGGGQVYGTEKHLEALEQLDTFIADIRHRIREELFGDDSTTD